MTALATVRTVLCRTTHPGNIGAAARALKNMGLDSLYLVAPLSYPSPEASAMAAGAEDLLDQARVVPDLATALKDCHYVVGTSARARHIGWTMLDVPEAAERLIAEAKRGPVALLYGQERAGLTNEEVDRCHALVQVPTNPAYPSLNLASAVLILSYELRRAAGEPGAPVAEPAEPAGSAGEMEHFYGHLEEVLVQTDFLDRDNPRLLMRRLRRLFNRARPDQNELNILRGILTSVQRAMRKS